MRETLLALLVAPALLSCGSDVVNYSAPVPIVMQVKSKDASGTSYALVGVSKNISTAPGNPFGAFVNDAQRALGRPPARIVATYATLQIEATSSPTTLTLNQVFAGAPPAVVVSFSLASATPVPVCFVNGPTGTAAAMTPVLDSSGLSAADFSSLLGGSFGVNLDGNATAAFATGAQTADLLVTVGFEAFK